MRRALVAVGLLSLAAAACANGSAVTGAVNAQAPAAARTAAKKRAAPPVVEPVVLGGVRYEVLSGGKARGLGQNGGDIVARDPASGAELYTLRVYKISYAANIEGDKQDVHITELVADADGKTLRVTDERGRHYRLDTRTRTVTPGP